MIKKKIQALETETKLAVNEIFGQFRYIVIDGEIYFIGKDVAEILGYKDTDQAIRYNVDEEDKKTYPVKTTGQVRYMIFINESGLYSLIFNSQLPTAKKFKRWVTSEVLPQIRKTGKYEMLSEVKEIPMENFLELVFKENPNADFDCQSVTLEERDGKIVPIYHIGLTSLNDDY